MITACGDVTALLSAWRAEDSQKLDKWVPLLHDELKRAAADIIDGSREKKLQSSLVIRQAYARMATQPHLSLQGRGHFFSVASRVMRHILVHQIRNKRGGPDRVCLENSGPGHDQQELLALNEALIQLAELVPRQARMVELSYFGGLNKGEIAEVMAISEAKVRNELRAARGWLFRELT